MRVTVRLSDALASHIDAVRHDSETSDAEAVRECIRRSERLEKLEQQIDELEADVDRLQNEKRLILEEREEKAELARYAEEQRTRQQRKDEASLGTRAKWWLFGMSDSEA
jgi:TolA-binding protein